MIKFSLLQLEILKILSSTEDRTLKPMLDRQLDTVGVPLNEAFLHSKIVILD